MSSRRCGPYQGCRELCPAGIPPRQLVLQRHDRDPLPGEPGEEDVLTGTQVVPWELLKAHALIMHPGRPPETPGGATGGLVGEACVQRAQGLS
jgi:hypothetical protein